MSSYYFSLVSLRSVLICFICVLFLTARTFADEPKQIVFENVVIAKTFSANDIKQTSTANIRQLDTEHYTILSNGSSEQITDVAERLEILHQVWTTLFLKTVFDSQTKPKRHRVFVYRNKDDYVKNLRRFDANIQQTDGFYLPSQQTAYFFYGHNNFWRTLYHEGTHQIFNEVARTPPVRFETNYWLVEGIALFMETLKIENVEHKIDEHTGGNTKTIHAKCTLGGITDNRLYAAKVYHFERNYRLPTRQLVAMNTQQVQTNKDIVKIYDQSAALTHLLMFAENGKYRNTVLRLLRLVYDRKDEADSLSKLTGLTFEQVDTMYAKFLETVPD